MVNALRATPRVAAPLNLPAACASVTVPEAAAPVGTTVLPPTVTGCATVASKRSPTALVFEPSACCNRTLNTVPAGITTGLGFGGGGGGSGAGVGWTTGAAAGAGVGALESAGAA